MKLSPGDFHVIRDFVHEKTGIFLKDQKAYFLESRLERRFKEIGCEDAREYYRLLKYDTSRRELDALIEILTINETYFFRDIKQLLAFSREALPCVVERKLAEGNKSITIWSAGCSTGDEPYTLAMLASEVMKKINIRIIATDINAGLVQFAKEGIYSGRALKNIPPHYLRRYFTPREDGYEVAAEIKGMTEYMALNLVDKTRMSLLSGLDFIFCRNVLIYFSHPVAKQVISRFYDSLNNGGYLFMGAAESMHLFSGSFTPVKFRKLVGYRKN